MPEPLTRDLQSVCDALEVSRAELRFHAKRLRELLRTDAETRAPRTVAMLERTAFDYERASWSVGRLLRHTQRRMTGVAPALRVVSHEMDDALDSIDIHGRARAFVEDATLAQDDAAHPHTED